MSITYFDTIDSTNLYLKENYEKYNNLDCVLARHQTNGRGRMGRVWIDQDDLLMSILVKEEVQEKEKLSLLICSTIFKVLSKYLNNLKIKWPNDILQNGKKICGILLEGKTIGDKTIVVIGFGINVNSTKFDDDLIIKATSLKKELNKEFDIKVLANEIYEEFLSDFSLFTKKDESYLKVCRDNSCLIGEVVSVEDNGIIKDAKVLDILDNGNILLLIDGKKIEKRSGEISLHNNY